VDGRHIGAAPDEEAVVGAPPRRTDGAATGAWEGSRALSASLWSASACTRRRKRRGPPRTGERRRFGRGAPRGGPPTGPPPPWLPRGARLASLLLRSSENAYAAGLAEGNGEWGGDFTRWRRPVVLACRLLLGFLDRECPLWWSLLLNGGKGKKIADTAQRNNRSGGGNEKLKLIWLFIL
jgi:hypothetical protein